MTMSSEFRNNKTLNNTLPRNLGYIVTSSTCGWCLRPPLTKRIRRHIGWQHCKSSRIESSTVSHAPFHQPGWEPHKEFKCNVLIGGNGKSKSVHCLKRMS